ncbi:MAG: hypothetical protein RLZZ458_7 [Planctomycetota bacterium]
MRLDTASRIGNNRAFYKMLRDGVEVEYSRPDGSIAGDCVRLVDFARPGANDWFAVNQFTVIESQHNRRAASGGVIFTTIRKFMPERGEKMPSLSDRRNIVVIADEAHRSQ